jgi:hypothetical protein
MSDGPKKQRIKGARKTKGRMLSGHADQIERRTFQETQHLEAVDRTMRKWRAEPSTKGHPMPEVSHLLSRLREAMSGVDGHLLGRATSDATERPRDRNGKAPQGMKVPSRTVERSLGGWIYTIRLPGGEIIGKRREEV